MSNFKRITILCVFLILSFFTHAQKQITNYINQYKAIAVQCMNENKIPASVILGISIVESAAGRSKVCKGLKNHFGIVGKNKNSIAKLGYKSKYKEYKSDLDSYEHFCKVVKKKKFYKYLKGSKDYKEWIKSLNQASYASAKGKWEAKIIETIRRYKLYELDKESNM